MRWTKEKEFPHECEPVVVEGKTYCRLCGLKLKR